MAVGFKKKRDEEIGGDMLSIEVFGGAVMEEE